MDKLPVLEPFSKPVKEVKSYLEKMLKWIQDSIYYKIAKRINWLLDRIQYDYHEITKSGNTVSLSGNYRHYISGDDIILQKHDGTQWNDYLTFHDGGSSSYLSGGIPYGEIYVHDNSTAKTVATGASYTLYDVWTGNGQSFLTTNDYSNGKITLTKSGIYKVNGSFSFASGTANVNVLGALFLNGTEQNQIHFRRKISTANDEGAASFTGFIDATSDALDVDMRMRHDYGSNVDITVTYANLNIIRFGDT